MICLFLGAVLCGGTAAAQHTLGVTGGYGYGNARFYPDQETRAVWGCYTAGVTWFLATSSQVKLSLVLLL